MSQRPGPTARLIAALELFAAWLLAAITALTFTSVVLRYAFNWSIPDSFDAGRNLLGIAIFWGIALAAYRGEHITVDLLWSALGPRARRIMDAFAGIVTLLCLAVFTWAMADKVLSTYRDNVLTFDLHLPVWIFYAVAWVGLALCIPLLLTRLWRQFTQPEAGEASATRTTPLKPG
jgi:TRAP-type C4-dicarboxylate transport system permease small subunit